MQYDKKPKKVKFSNMRFISCLDTDIGSASLAASYSSAEKLKQICSVLCRSSKYMLIQKFLLNKNICFSFLSLESKVISLLPYGTAGRGRVKWRDRGCKEQLCTTSTHLWLCQSKVWLGSKRNPFPPLPWQDTGAQAATLQPSAAPALLPAPASAKHQAAPTHCTAAPAQSSSKADIIQDT